MPSSWSIQGPQGPQVAPALRPGRYGTGTSDPHCIWGDTTAGRPNRGSGFGPEPHAEAVRPAPMGAHLSYQGNCWKKPLRGQTKPDHRGSTNGNLGRPLSPGRRPAKNWPSSGLTYNQISRPFTTREAVPGPGLQIPVPRTERPEQAALETPATQAAARAFSTPDSPASSRPQRLGSVSVRRLCSATPNTQIHDPQVPAPNPLSLPGNPRWKWSAWAKASRILLKQVSSRRDTCLLIHPRWAAARTTGWRAGRTGGLCWPVDQRHHRACSSNSSAQAGPANPTVTFSSLPRHRGEKPSLPAGALPSRAQLSR